ncbi:hypothetical protein [Halorubrum lipolyticum]|uniref:Uncharacterized protein n=1 Tax=Halorubrum lipolyticum DSM 21995 TaxID=1227482 RepID=M0NJW4_9EURY|nr:hypothetical protein [Halorubrum lipolyticum]EMA58277.1 hypothetical protein C469_13745 [Halorubrum lipolyticum DSM 21995]
MNDGPPPSAGSPAGDDPEAPYDGVDLSEYPRWWRENVRAFEEHGLRPYRPSRFADGEVVQSRRDALETELGVSIALRTVGPDPGGSWQICVDGEPVRSVSRRRTESGFTRYDIDSETFERCVRDAVSSRER